MGVDQTNCDPADIFSLKNQSIENQDYIDKQLCLCIHNFLQWLDHSQWVLEFHSDPLKWSESDIFNTVIYILFVYVYTYVTLLNF